MGCHFLLQRIFPTQFQNISITSVKSATSIRSFMSSYNHSQSPLPTPSNSTSYLYRTAFSGHFKQIEPYSEWSFVSDFFHLALTFLRVIHAIACISISFLFSIEWYPLVVLIDIWVVSHFLPTMNRDSVNIYI